MNQQEIAALIQTIIPIARQAGKRIMEIYDDIDNFNVELKDDNSPLTRADKEANELICSGLEKLNQKFPIISEENKEIPYADRKDFQYCWMVDPLDGTKEFIKRNGEFTVNIALLQNNRSIGGVVYAPATDDMYYASLDAGAHHKRSGKTRKLAASFYHTAEKALSIVCSRSHLNEQTQAFIDDYHEPLKVSKGSSLKFLIIAEGNAHLYPRLAPTMEWDTAAAQIILEEAGGQVLRADDGLPLSYNKADLLNPYFIACANKLA